MWKSGEIGPTCPCGRKTVVMVEPDCTAPECLGGGFMQGGVGLLCFAHTKESAEYWPLPKEKPDDWEDLKKDWDLLKARMREMDLETE